MAAAAVQPVHARWTVACHVRSGSCAGPTKPQWIQGVLEEGAPWLDVSGASTRAAW